MHFEISQVVWQRSWDDRQEFQLLSVTLLDSTIEAPVWDICAISFETILYKYKVRDFYYYFFSDVII